MSVTCRPDARSLTARKRSGERKKSSAHASAITLDKLSLTTRIPYLPHSMAAPCVRPRTANFDAEYGVRRANGWCSEAFVRISSHSVRSSELGRETHLVCDNARGSDDPALGSGLDHGVSGVDVAVGDAVDLLLQSCRSVAGTVRCSGLLERRTPVVSSVQTHVDVEHSLEVCTILVL